MSISTPIHYLRSENVFGRYQILAPCLFLFTAVFLTYSNVYNNVLLFDDGLLIVLNNHLKSWHSALDLLSSSTISGAHISGGFYRPLQMLLYLVVYQIQGPIPFGFHFLNVLLHAVNACLLYLLGRKLKIGDGVSFLAALLWALHPVHTEAVTYVSGTADPLYTVFCLLGSLIILPDFSYRRILGASLCMLLALASKETAAIFPLLVISLAYGSKTSCLNRKTLLRTTPLWLIAICYSVWRLRLENFDGPLAYDKLYFKNEFANLALYAHHFTYRLYTFWATLPDYATLMLWPHDLHMERSFPVYVEFFIPQVVTGCLITLASVFIVLRNTKLSNALGYGLLWFAFAYAPNTGLMFPINALFLEHWMYLPTAGLFLGLSESAHIVLQSKFLKIRFAEFFTAIFALLIALVLSCVTYQQNKIWRDPITFYTHILSYGVGTARVHNNLALAYIDDRKYKDAIDEFRIAISITDNYAEIHHNLAIALLHLPNQNEHIEEAIKELKRAIEIDPNFYRSYGLLAYIYESLGKTEQSQFYKKKLDAIDSKLPSK